MQAIDKPDELLELHDVTEELFDTLKGWFDVADEVTISLDDVDGAVEELGDPVMIAALAMRKLQALRLLSQPGVRTTTDVVVTIVQDLDRALLQAPTMWLKRAAAHAGWDAALAAMAAHERSRATRPVRPGERHATLVSARRTVFPGCSVRYEVCSSVRGYRTGSAGPLRGLSTRASHHGPGVAVTSRAGRGSTKGSAR